MPQQQDPRMVQWQTRFQTAQRMAQEPRKPQETPEQFQMRQRAAYEQLRELQTTKPSAPSAQGRMGGQKPAPRQGAMGLYDYIASALGGG